MYTQPHWHKCAEHLPPMTRPRNQTKKTPEPFTKHIFMNFFSCYLKRSQTLRVQHKRYRNSPEKGIFLPLELVGQVMANWWTTNRSCCPAVNQLERQQQQKIFLPGFERGTLRREGARVNHNTTETGLQSGCQKNCKWADSSYTLRLGVSWVMWYCDLNKKKNLQKS